MSEGKRQLRTIRKRTRAKEEKEEGKEEVKELSATVPKRLREEAVISKRPETKLPTLTPIFPSLTGVTDSERCERYKMAHEEDLLDIAKICKLVDRIGDMPKLRALARQLIRSGYVTDTEILSNLEEKKLQTMTRDVLCEKLKSALIDEGIRIIIPEEVMSAGEIKNLITDYADANVPTWLEDQATHLAIDSPIITPSGTILSRSTLDRLLAQPNPTDPITRAPLIADYKYIPVRPLTSALEDWLLEHTGYNIEELNRLEREEIKRGREEKRREEKEKGVCVDRPTIHPVTGKYFCEKHPLAPPYIITGTTSISSIPSLTSISSIPTLTPFTFSTGGVSSSSSSYGIPSSYSSSSSSSSSSFSTSRTGGAGNQCCYPPILDEYNLPKIIRQFITPPESSGAASQPFIITLNGEFKLPLSLLGLIREGKEEDKEKKFIVVYGYQNIDVRPRGSWFDIEMKYDGRTLRSILNEGGFINLWKWLINEKVITNVSLAKNVNYAEEEGKIELKPIESYEYIPDFLRVMIISPKIPEQTILDSYAINSMSISGEKSDLARIARIYGKPRVADYFSTH